MADNTQQPQLTDDEQRLLDQLVPEAEHERSGFDQRRRDFLKMISVATGGVLVGPLLGAEALAEPAVSETYAASLENTVNVGFSVNGTARSVAVDSRMTLLDTLRERLDLTGSKKGCDHGQCGSCTVLIGGRRVLACLTMAATCEGKAVTTIEGIANGTNGATARLHPMQAAFIKHDGYQCGYCTPGQICAAIALMDEAKRGDVSYVTANVRVPAQPLELSDEEIRERMSGNICRCAAYNGIVDAIREVHTGREVVQVWQFPDGRPTPAGQ